jgi:hypothetical protein
MGVSGQHHSLIMLYLWKRDSWYPQDSWAPELVWMQKIEEKFFAPA